MLDDITKIEYTDETIIDYVKNYKNDDIHQHILYNIVWERVGKYTTLLKQYKKDTIFIFYNNILIHKTNYKDIGKRLGENINSIYEIYNHNHYKYIEYEKRILINYNREKKLRRVLLLK